MTAPAAAPPVPAPPQIGDLPAWKKLPLRAWLLALGVAGGFIAVRAYAGAYFDLTQAVPAVKHAYDTAFPVDWIRHLLIRDESEKAEALIVVQVIGYYFARKWPRKAPGRLDRLEGWLGVANERLPRQGVHVLFLAPLWALVYVLPGEGIGAGLLWVTHQNAAEPAPWQIFAVGLLGSVIFGRRLARGFAYRLQQQIIRARREHGKTTPAWWMIWPIQRRFEWELAQGTIEPRPTRHPALRRAWHGLALTAVLAAVVVLTYQGWWVMKYLQPFPFGNPLEHVATFRISDLWQGLL